MQSTRGSGAYFWWGVFFASAICFLLVGIAALLAAPLEWFAASAADDPAGLPAVATPAAIDFDPVAAAHTPPAFASESGANAAAEKERSVPPAQTAAPSPTVSTAQVDFVADILKPLVSEANRRRAAAKQADGGAYARRIDGALSANRLNFLVTGYGVTFEAPYKPTYKGHVTLYSLNLQNLQIAAVTLNHDIRAPEVERYSARAGRTIGPTKLDRAYLTGGFDLARLTVEDATGLNVDYQLVFQDSVVQHIVDDVFGGLVVDVPYVFDSQPIVYAERQYPALRFAKGRQKLNGLQALQFIKGINAQLGKTRYDPAKEPAARKQIVVTAMLEATKRETTNPVFWARMLAFLRRTLDSKEIQYDFDAASLVFQVINRYVAQGAGGQKIPFVITRSVFVVDRAVGDGGVQWVGTSTNPIMVRDVKNGVYGDMAVAVPSGRANPYADDLPTNYWTSVRQLVKRKLASP